MARSFSPIHTSTRPLSASSAALSRLTSPDGDVVLESMPADVFIIATESGMLPVTFDPRDKHTDNWADD